MFADQQIWPLKTSWMADFIYKKLCPPEDFKYRGSCEVSTVKKLSADAKIKEKGMLRENLDLSHSLISD